LLISGSKNVAAQNSSYYAILQLLADEEAVRNAFSPEWNNGQVKGQVIASKQSNGKWTVERISIS
jgi:hypothetical protein